MAGCQRIGVERQGCAAEQSTCGPRAGAGSGPVREWRDQLSGGRTGAGGRGTGERELHREPVLLQRCVNCSLARDGRSRKQAGCFLRRKVTMARSIETELVDSPQVEELQKPAEPGGPDRPAREPAVRWRWGRR